MTPHQKKNVRNWIKALRSGDYQQAHGNLWHGGAYAGYCCLGVFSHTLRGKMPSKNRCFLSPDERHESGLSCEQTLKLVDFNDEDERSFKWIATWLERHHLKEKVAGG